MGKLIIICVILVFSSNLFISTPSGYARKLVPAGHAETKLMLPNINSQLGKFDRLIFYVHDVPDGAGENANVYEVARASITSGSRSSFGLVRVMDNLLTQEPDRNSMKIGRIQGIITSVDLERTAFAMSLNIVFTAGDLKPRTTLSIQGRCEINQEECEMPVVGGSGTYSAARGAAMYTSYSPGVLRYAVYVSYIDY